MGGFKGVKRGHAPEIGSQLVPRDGVLRLYRTQENLLAARAPTGPRYEHTSLPQAL